jgi:TetR/AcrR family transcriptional repressor of nem operon
MRLTKEQTAENRRRIVATAARLFRERGFDGVGVADIMNEAGFTHGGFYNHFASKEALAAEVCASAFVASEETLASALRSGKPRALERFVEEYLSGAHRDDPASGCTLVALATDAARQGNEVQSCFAGGVGATLELVAEWLRDAGPPSYRGDARKSRAFAITLWSELVGAMTLSRSMQSADPKLADEILGTTRRRILAALRAE